MTDRTAFLAPTLIVVLITIGLGISLPMEDARFLFSEDRLVENATLVVYGLAIADLLLSRYPGLDFRFHSALVMAILAARELDLHKAFTAESLLKISYYAKPDDPLATRIVAGFVVLALLVLVIGYLGHAKAFVRNLWDARGFAITLAFAFFILPFSKLLDSSPRMANKFLGYDAPDELRFWMFLFEESLEFLFPLLIILAIWQYNRAAKAREARATQKKTERPRSQSERDLFGAD